MKELKDLLHELRCDIAAIPENEENKIEIQNAQETLSKAFELLHSGSREQLKCEDCEKTLPKDMKHKCYECWDDIYFPK